MDVSLDVLWCIFHIWMSRWVSCVSLLLLGLLKSFSQPLVCYSFLSKIVAAIIVYRMSLILQTPNSTENIVKTSLAQPKEIDVFLTHYVAKPSKWRPSESLFNTTILIQYNYPYGV